MMKELDRGAILLTLEPVDESNRGRRIILYTIYPLMNVFIPVWLGVYYYLAGLSEFFYIVFPIIFFIMTLVADLVLQKGLSRFMGPVTIYTTGIEPPQAWIDRLTRKSTFFEKERISALQSYLPGQEFNVGPCVILHMRIKKGWTVSFGIRRKEEVERLIEFAVKDWAVDVERLQKTINKR